MRQASTTRAAWPAMILLLPFAICGPIPAHPQQGAAIEMVRQISDPSSGALWILLRDAVHPEGPGRLVLSASASTGPRDREEREIKLQPVIRQGDRLIVEESTSVAEARLEAVALGTAAVGSTLRVRLKIGGRTIQAVALAAGRAKLTPEKGARP